MAKEKNKGKKRDAQTGKYVSKGEKSKSSGKNRDNPPKDKIGTSGTGAKNKKDKK